jgi:hypothetical protein
MPPDVRKASGFPIKPDPVLEAPPRLGRRSLQVIKDERSRKGTAFPHIRRQSRYFPATDLHWPYFQAQRLADRMSVTMKAGIQYLTDVNGERTGVILSLEQYERLLEDVHDMAIVGDRLDEEPVSLEELKNRLKLTPC